jgi:hypothetical protein
MTWPSRDLQTPRILTVQVWLCAIPTSQGHIDYKKLVGFGVALCNFYNAMIAQYLLALAAPRFYLSF